MARKHYDRVVCADGFAMSVQASVYNYCQPQEADAPKYDLVEIGFPTAKEPMLMSYAETPEDPTGTVYAYVPVELVTNVIVKHGGMVSGEVPPGVIAIRA
jgi:hypothetical protein